MPGEPTPYAAERDHEGDRHGLLAFSIYLTFSLLVFGRPLLGHFRDTYIGRGSDPSVSMWYFVWWPYALVHRLDPFFTDLIWAPNGVNLAWKLETELALKQLNLSGQRRLSDPDNTCGMGETTMLAHGYEVAQPLNIDDVFRRHLNLRAGCVVRF